MGGAPSKNPLGLPDDQVAVYKASFDAFDADGCGSIDAQELEGLLTAFGVRPTAAELEKMIHEVDADGSGEIGFEEFLRMVVLRMERNMMGDKAAVLQGFNVFDENKNGVVTAEELESAMMKLRDIGMEIDHKEIAAMIKVADKDKTGMVEFDELWGYAEGRMQAEKGQRAEI